MSIQPREALMVSPDHILSTGPRRRKDSGDLTDLRASIRKHGILEPILCRRTGPEGVLDLMAGFRRLTVARALNLDVVPILDFGPLSDDEAREVELAENTGRKDFTTYEASAKRLAEISAAVEEIEREKAEAKPTRVLPSGKVKPASTKATRREIADRTGVSPATQAKIERHAKMVERFPVLKDWLRGDVLAVEDALTKVPAAIGKPIIRNVAPVAKKPEEVVSVIETLAVLPETAREALLKQEPEAILRACRTAPPAEPPLLRTIGAMLAMISGARTKDAARIPGVVSKLDGAAVHLKHALANVEAARDKALARWREGR